MGGYGWFYLSFEVRRRQRRWRELFGFGQMRGRRRRWWDEDEDKSHSQSKMEEGIKGTRANNLKFWG
jgi:hypothetical protein